VLKANIQPKVAILVVDPYPLRSSRRSFFNIKPKEERIYANIAKTISCAKENGVAVILAYRKCEKIDGKIERAAEGAKLIDKVDFDAFAETGLKDYLGEKGINKLVVCGTYASICIKETVQTGLKEGFDIVMSSRLVYDSLSLAKNAKNLMYFIKNTEFYFTVKGAIEGAIKTA